MSHPDHGALVDTSPPRGSDELIDTHDALADQSELQASTHDIPSKRSRTALGSSESDEGISTEQMISDEIQNRLAPICKHVCRIFLKNPSCKSTMGN